MLTTRNGPPPRIERSSGETAQRSKPDGRARNDARSTAREPGDDDTPRRKNAECSTADINGCLLIDFIKRGRPQRLGSGSGRVRHARYFLIQENLPKEGT